MKINLVKARNYTGADFEYPLAGCDLFTGPNGCGKSRIIDTVDFVLRGRMAGASSDQPHILYDERATHRDANIAYQIRVQNEDAEEPVARFLGPDKKSGKIGQVIKFRAKEYGARTGQPLIDEFIKPCAEAIDITKFTALSDDPRNKNSKSRYLLGLVNEPEGFTRQSVLDRLRNKAKGDAAIVEKSLGEIFEAWPGNTPAHIGILEISDVAKSMLSDAYKTARTAGETERSLQEIEREQKQLSGDIVTIRNNLSEAKRRELQLAGLIADAESKSGEHQRWADARKDYEVTLANAQNNLSIVKTGNGTHDAEIADLKSRLTSTSDYEQWEAELQDLGAKLIVAKQETDAAAEVLSAKRVEIKTCEKIIEVFGQDKVKCPAVPGMGCRVTADQKQKIVEQAQSDLATHNDALPELEADYSKADAEYNGLLVESNQITGTLKINKAADTEIQHAIKLTEEKKKAYNDQVALLENDITTQKAKLEKHKAAEPHVTGIADIGVMKQEQTGLQTRIPELEDDLAKKQQDVALKKAEATKQRERFEAEALQEILKNLIVEITNMVTEILAASLGPVEAAINDMLPDRYRIVIGAESGQPFGITDHGEYRALGAISGGEWAIVLAAVSVAFMNLRGQKLRVLMCELGEVDRDNVILLCAMMARAVENGQLDNFIGCKCLGKSEPDYPAMPGVEVWRLPL